MCADVETRFHNIESPPTAAPSVLSCVGLPGPSPLERSAHMHSLPFGTAAPRFAALLLVAAFAASLTGCGGDSSSPAAPAPAPALGSDAASGIRRTRNSVLHICPAGCPNQPPDPRHSPRGRRLLSGPRAGGPRPRRGALGTRCHRLGWHEGVGRGGHLGGLCPGGRSCRNGGARPAVSPNCFRCF